MLKNSALLLFSIFCTANFSYSNTSLRPPVEWNLETLDQLENEASQLVEDYEYSRMGFKSIRQPLIDLADRLTSQFDEAKARFLRENQASSDAQRFFLNRYYPKMLQIQQIVKHNEMFSEPKLLETRYLAFRILLNNWSISYPIHSEKSKEKLEKFRKELNFFQEISALPYQFLENTTSEEMFYSIQLGIEVWALTLKLRSISDTENMKFIGWKLNNLNVDSQVILFYSGEVLDVLEAMKSSRTALHLNTSKHFKNSWSLREIEASF